MVLARETVTREFVAKLLEGGQFLYWMSRGSRRDHERKDEIVFTGGCFEDDTLVIGSGGDVRYLEVVGLTVNRNGWITVDLPPDGPGTAPTAILWPADESSATQFQNGWKGYQQLLRTAEGLERVLAWCLSCTVRVNSDANALLFDFNGYFIRVTIAHLPGLPPGATDMAQAAAWIDGRNVKLSVDKRRLLLDFDGYQIKVAFDHLPDLPSK